MTCPYCKNVIDARESSCPVCGTRLAPAGEGAAGLHPYYAGEFQAIAGGRTPRFNTAAFLGGPFHLLYRGCGWRCLRLYGAYLLTLLLLGASCLLRLPDLLWELFLYGAHGGLGSPITVLAWLCAAWGLVLAVYNGNTFNRYFYEKRRGDAVLRRHPAGPALLAAVVLALALAGAARAGGMLAAGILDYEVHGAFDWRENLDDGFYTDPAEGFYWDSEGGWSAGQPPQESAPEAPVLPGYGSQSEWDWAVP